MSDSAVLLTTQRAMKSTVVVWLVRAFGLVLFVGSLLWFYNEINKFFTPLLYAYYGVELTDTQLASVVNYNVNFLRFISLGVVGSFAMLACGVNAMSYPGKEK